MNLMKMNIMMMILMILFRSIVVCIEWRGE